jgi:hypothetical protein
MTSEQISQALQRSSWLADVLMAYSQAFNLPDSPDRDAVLAEAERLFNTLDDVLLQCLMAFHRLGLPVDPKRPQ